MNLHTLPLAALSFSLALLASSFPSRAAENAELFRTAFSYPNTAKGKRYELVVRQSDVNGAPVWSDDRPTPPLPPRQAIAIATEFAHKFFPESTNPPVFELTMKSVGPKGQWIYIASLELRSQPGWEPNLAFSLPILMNGRVVEPKAVPFGEEDDLTTFFLKKAPVLQVLQIYRDYAGGPLAGADLKTSEDVPLNAEISVGSQSATKTEALRIIEKALREQAGVVVTRIATHQFSVTFDPTVKTGNMK